VSTPDEQDVRIDVGGIGLAVRVTGARPPAVVMLPSSGGAHEQWDQLRERLEDTLCVTYGRPGLGGSEALSPSESAVPRSVGWAADQLHDLLSEVAAIEPSFVLVGCSIGGWIADQFAARWPDQVAGLVQVDPTYIDPIPRMTRDRPIDDADGAGITFAWDAVQTELTASPPPPPRRAVVISRAFGTVPAEVIERAWRPLTAIEADHGWRARQADWARRLGAVHIAADHAGHHVQIDQPDLVAMVVRALAHAVRSDTDLNLPSTEVVRAGGHLLNA
jgi:pimeloyl-ACP methyl ester carboxylesterase